MAIIAPSPLAKRVGQIRKQAQNMVWRSQDTAEKYLECY
jgi:hypothetical protein